MEEYNKNMMEEIKEIKEEMNTRFEELKVLLTKK
jgi:hypothetical protein